MRLTAILFVSALALLNGCSGGGNGSRPPSLPALPTAPLAASDVSNLITGAVTQASHDGAAISVAVTDREGNLLGQFTMNGAPVNSPSPDLLNTTTKAVALEKARTAAFLSSDQNAFSTRTGAFIVQSHFPPGVRDTDPGPLFGLPFSSLPCSDVQPRNGITGASGGIPVYLNGAIAGGIGVDGASGDENEAIALAGASGPYATPPAITANNIDLGGIQLVYVATAPSGLAPLASLAGMGSFDTAPTGTPATAFPAATFAGVPGEIRFPIVSSLTPAPAAGGLSATDVNTIITSAVSQAATTRAAIRLPIGIPARFQVGITDLAGNILGVFRMSDATMFSLDIVIQKGRSVTSFSDPTQPFGGQIRSLLGLSATQPAAFTTRTIGFLAQPFYPPGVDGNSPGPLFGIQENAVAAGNACITSYPGGNDGICLFAGSVPLYKNGVLVGGLGISGDGIDQDDFVAAAGANGFTPDPSITADNFSFKGTPLPYVKFPRHPTL